MSTSGPQGAPAAVGATGCRELSRTYRRAGGRDGGRAESALRSVTADFPAGAVTVIRGPSGSGKSTLLRLLAGLDRADAGEVWLAGRPLTGLRRRALTRMRRTQVGWLFPDPVDNLVEYLTVREQVRLAARLRGASADEQDLVAALAGVGLGHRLDHRPATLSGGEQQRVAVVCALVGRPALVAADEPTAQLDSAATGRVLDALAAAAANGSTVVVASHDEDVVARADRLVRLDHGRVVDGP